MGFFSKLFSPKKVTGLHGNILLGNESVATAAAISDTLSIHFSETANLLIEHQDNKKFIDALSIYADIIFRVKLANNICLDWIEESDNAIDERAGIQAACTLAQGRILIDYFKATTDNIYTSKNQSFVESMLYDLRQGYNNIERMVQQLGIKSFVDNLAGSFCDHLYSDDVSQLVNERLHTILTNRKI